MGGVGNEDCNTRNTFILLFPFLWTKKKKKKSPMNGMHASMDGQWRGEWVNSDLENG